MAFFSGGGDLPSRTPLDQAELSFFNQAIEKLSSVSSLARRMPELFTEDKADYQLVAEMAKEKFSSRFGGVVAASGEFGVQFIRPKVVAYTNWYKNITATGWQNLWGSSGSEIAMPDSSGARAFVAFPAVVSFGPSPHLQEFKFFVKGNETPIINVTPWMSVGEVHIAKLGGMVVLGPGESFYARANAETIGQEWIAPFGLEFAIGVYLRTE